jgi:hypothetical protein
VRCETAQVLRRSDSTQVAANRPDALTEEQELPAQLVVAAVLGRLDRVADDVAPAEEIAVQLERGALVRRRRRGARRG